MDIITKAVNATIQDTSASDDVFPGTFEVELSNESVDRDGDLLKADEWENPLPQQITFINDHTHKMASVVGSATPALENGKIICRGTWAKTQNAQETRKVIPHVPYVSVAYREKRDRKAGTVSRELINGSFVVVPANPHAKVLSSKGFAADIELTDETKEFIKSVVESALSIKQEFDSNHHVTGSVLPSGFTAETEMDTEKTTHTLHIKDASGKVLLAHEFPASTTLEKNLAPETSPAPAAADPADQEKKEPSLAVLRAKALRFETRHVNN